MESQAIIWQSGIWSTKTQDIVRAFEMAGDDLGDELKKLYHIYPDRPTSCATGALDFINDFKFVMPLELLGDMWRGAGVPIFRALVDESNPWQPSTGAHHGVDVLLLFSGFDLSFAPAVQKTAEKMREVWIRFVSGDEPWDCEAFDDRRYGFGPYGISQLLDDQQLYSRRRLFEAKKLRRMSISALERVFTSLAAGKVSLLN